MIWVAGACLTAGVLLIVLTPLLGKRKTPVAPEALTRQKLRVADELAALGKMRAAGSLTGEEFTAQQKALETEALALLDAEKQATAAPHIQDNRNTVRMLTAALAFVLTANAAAGIYLYQGGYHALAGGASSPDQSGPMMSGQGGAPDPNAMVARLEERLKENPNDASGQAMLGRSYMVLERFEDSAAAYRKAVELDPAEIGYQVGLGVATIRLGKTDEAFTVFNGVLKKEPDNPDALWFLAMLQVHRKDVPAAEKTWKKLLDVTPEESKAEMQQEIEKIRQMLQK